MVGGMGIDSQTGWFDKIKRTGQGPTEICQHSNAGKDHFGCTFLHICEWCRGDHQRINCIKSDEKTTRKIENWRLIVQNPQYLCGYIWGTNLGLDTPSVLSALLRDPLPGVPINDYKHGLVTQTINDNLHLFRIVTPI